MTRHLDPLLLRDHLRNTLVRYLSTAVPVSNTRAPKLACVIRKVLKNNAPQLTKGPFLESLPDFRKKGSIRELINSEVLTQKWCCLEKTGFTSLLDRPLHEHQEHAIRQAAKNRNFIVATGTGSGKTECFLLPIVDHLLRDPNLSEPGVRAVIVYPLNALANDQLYFRLAPLLLRQLRDPGITFGRFTGQVRANADRSTEEERLLDNDTLKEALGLSPLASRLPRSWLLSRSEMLQTPPHILITNYAMLEHLLLLPRNAPLFHNARLRFLVLDEIHTYAGAQAIEVAFLLRKLKVQLGLEAGGKLQVVGTSASLNAENPPKLARFASDIFGENFNTETDLISGKREIHPALLAGSAEISLSAKKWIDVEKVIISMMQSEDEPTVDDWNVCCEDVDDALLLDHPDLKKALTSRLAKISEVRIVARELGGGFCAFEDLAVRVFPDASRKNRNRALRSLIRTAIFARPDNSEFPILPARYHLAVTGIEGGVVRLHAEAEEGWSDFRPKKSHNDENGVPYFSLLPCRNCGEPYFEGWYSYSDGIMFGKPVSGAERTVFRIAALAKNTAIEMGAGEEDFLLNEVEEYQYIDSETGLSSSSEFPGGVKIVRCELQEDKDEKRHYLRMCVVCGNRTVRFPEPISFMHPGNDALSAVTIQVLFENLPAYHDAGQLRPLAGKKLLVFSDNRQDAAFFAPFFERTSMYLTLRTCIVQVVRESARSRGIIFRRMRDQVWLFLGLHGQVAYKAHHEMEDLSDADVKEMRLYLQIVAEFFTPRLVRASLEGLGIVSVEYDQQILDKLVKDICITEKDFTDEEARAFAELTLDRIRSERAIANPNNKLDLSDETIWGAFKNQPGRCMVLEKKPKQHRSTIGFLPKGSATNRSTWMLEERLNLSRDRAFKVLDIIWRRSRRERLLGPVGTGYGLDIDKLRIADGTKRPFYECDTCGTRTFRSVRLLCPSWKCDGNLLKKSQSARRALEKENHYAHLYTRKVIDIEHGQNAIAKEHSAVIGGRFREMVEESFRTGRINLLSCTTTLELGVDLGDLEAIVCKNVPPGVVNYQQRTGRAGRRAQAAPIALTIARNSNYDQACYVQFDRYLSDPPAIPHLALDNADFFRRHQISVILARFFSSHIEKDGVGAPRIKDLLGKRLAASDACVFMDTFDEWLASLDGAKARGQAHRLISTLPEKSRPIGLQDDELVTYTHYVLNRFVRDIASRWELLQERMIEAREAEHYMVAAAMQRQQKNLLNQFLVNALSRSAVIPTYSFPVHTCRIEIIREKGQRPTPFGNLDADLQLDRSAGLAISEYAPEAEIVAGGRIWTSRGIVRYPKDFMPTRSYRICDSCGHVTITEDSQTLKGQCSQCAALWVNSRRARRFIEPKGFLTSWEERRGRDPGSTRMRQRTADEARLVTRAPDHQYKDTDLAGVRSFYAPAFPMDGNEDLRGRLLIVNRGPRGGGYIRCTKCEYAVPATQDAVYGKYVEDKHVNPRTGANCLVKKMQRPVDLGCIFETDVRAFAFAKPIPKFDEDENDEREADEESFLRTLAEALRLAAVQLLQVDSRDLAATFQRKGHRPVAILYDSVPGGAGYSRRIGNGETLSTKNFVSKAVNVLTCHADCASSCIRCLNDYGNQAYWDKFDRHKVLDWLRALASSAQSNQDTTLTKC